MSLTSSTFTLVATMVGGGTLSLPFAVGCMGWLAGPVTLCLICVLVTYCLGLLVQSSQAAGMGDKGSFEDVVGCALGSRARILTAIIIILLTGFAAVAYLLLLAQLLAPLLSLITCHDLGRSWNPEIIAAISVINLPVCSRKSLSSMKFNSYMSVCSTTVLLFVLTVRSGQCLTGRLHGEEFYWCRFPRYDETRAAAMPQSLFDTLLAVPVMAGAFVCHFNVLPMHAELKRPTYDRVMRVINQTFTLVAMGYMSIGIVGFLPLGREVCDNILLNYSANDMLINVGRVALSCTLTLSYPNLILPCRTTLVRLINTTWAPPEGIQQLLTTEAAPLLSPGPRSLEPDVPRVGDRLRADYLDMEDFRTRFAVTLALVAGAGSIASLTSKVSTIWSLLGCTIVSLVAFILPCALYIRICRPKGRARLGPTAIIWVSSLMSVACLVAAFMDFSRTNPSLSPNTRPCETRPYGADFTPACLFPSKHHVLSP